MIDSALNVYKLREKYNRIYAIQFTGNNEKDCAHVLYKSTYDPVSGTDLQEASYDSRFWGLYKKQISEPRLLIYHGGESKQLTRSIAVGSYIVITISSEGQYQGWWTIGPDQFEERYARIVPT